MYQKINLMQWRSRRKKKILTLMLIDLGIWAGLALLILSIWATFWSTKIQQQLEVNTYLNQQISLLNRENAKITQLNRVRDDLVARVNIIRVLQEDRPHSVLVWEAFSLAMPSSTYITSLVNQNDIVTIDGRASSNRGVSELMRNFNLSPYFGEPNLESINLIGSGDNPERAFKIVVPVQKVKVNVGE